MDFELFSDQLKGLGKRVLTLRENISTEEATKTSLIMPFFQILGYDIFNPLEFVPEFTADVGIKKGEKVDYAIIMDSNPVMLIEAKAVTENLTRHDSQLFRYFSTTTSKFGVLTNGVEYKFFTDLDEPNKMDSTPFLTVDITKLRDVQIQEIAKFHKENFDIGKITSSASELKYLYAIKDFIATQSLSPSEEFVKYIVGEIYEGVKTKTTIEKFTPLVQKGFSQFINDSVNEKLSTALNSSIDTKISSDSVPVEAPAKKDVEAQIVTTPEELESYAMAKVVLKEVISPDRVFYRDNLSYFNILIDDNIRKWVVRVLTVNNQLRLVFNDSDTDATRTKVDIASPISIIDHADKIKEVVQAFI